MKKIILNYTVFNGCLEFLFIDHNHIESFFSIICTASFIKIHFSSKCISMCECECGKKTFDSGKNKYFVINKIALKIQNVFHFDGFSCTVEIENKKIKILTGLDVRKDTHKYLFSI